MANKRILKLTNAEAIIKIDGPVGTVTIDLDVDLVGDNEVVDNPVVNFVSLLSAGEPAGAISLTRNAEVLYSVTTGTISKIDLQDERITDGTNNTFDLVVTTSGAECQCIIRLRKVSGYKTTVEVNG